MVVLFLVGACTRANPDAVRDAATMLDLGAPGGSDGAPPRDGGVDQRAPSDQGGPPDLGEIFHGVSCGAVTCDPGAEICCASQLAHFCEAAGQFCPGGAIIRCDGPEDCPPGDLCCGGGSGTSCQLGCGSAHRLCHTEADCHAGTFCCPLQGSTFSACSDRACP
jgi:hypothetical protein